MNQEEIWIDTSKQYKKGYEMHPNEINTHNAPHNDLPHIIMERLA